MAARLQANTRGHQERKNPTRKSGVQPKYLYMSNSSHAAGVTAAGAVGFANSVKTPDSLSAAEMVLFKLHAVLSHEGDKATSGFGETYAAPTVNYHTMFKVLDMDANQLVERGEWTRVIRRVLAIKTSDINDEELMVVYEAVDVDKSGSISLGEWAAFARGGRWTSPHHHQGHIQSTSWGMKDNVSRNTRVDAPTANMPHYSDRKLTQCIKGKHHAEPEGLDKLHLILWHLAQATESDKKTGRVSINPGNNNFNAMYKKLNLDKNNRVTREDWALVLRRHVGVGRHVSDDDLASIFDEMDKDNNGTISLAEFAAFARGAATPSAARGLSHEVAKRTGNLAESALADFGGVADAPAAAAAS